MPPFRTQHFGSCTAAAASHFFESMNRVGAEPDAKLSIGRIAFEAGRALPVTLGSNSAAKTAIPDFVRADCVLSPTQRKFCT